MEDFTAPIAVSEGSGTVMQPRAASDGSSYLLVWPENVAGTTSIAASRWNGQAWSAPELIETSDFSAGSSGYAVCWLQREDGDHRSGIVSLAANVFSGGAWLGPTSIETRPHAGEDLMAGRLASNGTGYALA